MRKVLFVSLAVLFLLLLRRAGRVERRGAQQGGSGRGRDVTVLSTGRGFDRQAIGYRRFMAAVLIDDLFLEHERQRDGLYVATLSPRRSLEDVRSFDLAHSGTDILAFLAHCRAQPIDTVLAMAVNRSIGLSDESGLQEAIPMLGNLFEELGARATPYRDQAASWVFVCARTPRGWVSLGEQYSTYTGVRLDVALPGDAELIQSGQGRYFAATNAGPVRNVHLVDFLQHRSQVPGTAILEQPSHLTSDYVDTIVLPPDSSDLSAQPKRFLWPEVALGGDPVFACKLAGPPGTDARPHGIDMLLLVDGGEAGRATFAEPTGPAAGWQEWRVALSGYAGRTVDVELLISAETPTAFPGASIGDPVVSYNR